MVLVAVACAWCERVRTASGWESATTDLNSPAVTHGICPECLDRVARDLYVPAGPEPAPLQPAVSER
jgi:hypothetical protein